MVSMEVIISYYFDELYSIQNETALDCIEKVKIKTSSSRNISNN